MNNAENKAEHAVHEPFIHITKRDDLAWWKAMLIRLGAVVVALAVCSLFIVLLTHVNPITIFTKMYEGSFNSPRRIWNFLQNTAILLGIALAITPAFKMRFWNIGAEGQVLVSCLASAACTFYIKDSLPSWQLLLIMLVASIAAGMIWAGIPGFFKAKWNTNETLFTLMMNYVAVQLVSLMIFYWIPSGSMKMPIQNELSQNGYIPSLFNRPYFLNVIIVIALVIFMFIYLRFSKHGYEISVVGESENTARYIGINVKKVIIRTVLFSGAICGIMGWIIFAGKDHMVSAESVGGNGFTAIMVSWLAKFNPLFMVITSALVCFLQIGSGALAEDVSLHLDTSLGDIITGIVILFIIGSEFFIRYKINFRERKSEEV